MCDLDDVVVVGRPLVQGAVRAMRVVVVDGLDEQRLELGSTPSSDPEKEVVSAGG